MARYTGSGAPYEEVRLQACERMGWTFKEYDETPAIDMYQAFELWRIQAEKKH